MPPLIEAANPPDTAASAAAANPPRTPALPAASRVAPAFADATGLKNMQLLIQLRWMATYGQLVTIAVVHFGFDIRLPLENMLSLFLVLIVFNLASQWRWRKDRNVRNAELFVALLVDVGMLTAQLYLSGGATNPFVFLYLLQVTLAAVLLKSWSTWTMVGITTLCFAFLAMFGQPLALPPDHDRGLASPYIQGMLICFMLNAALQVTFIIRIGRNLRERDAHLADLRQRAAEEEHIVRMGLLASGAAHELGTPLATLAVILGDWCRMPFFTSDPELLQEVNEMQAQVQRCKTIVSGILLSAGEARGESSVETTLSTFMDELAREWRATRPVVRFSYENHIDVDLPMVSDSALKQMVCNVLDNALEASPRWTRLAVTRDDETLMLTVTDEGPGFSPAMLAQIGKPYQSSKGRPGSGLGLFLVLNVARTLGGTVAAHNRPEGGAVVTLRLPLEAIALEPLDAMDDSTPQATENPDVR